MEFKYEIDNTYIHYIKFGTGKKNLVIISGVSLSGFEGLGVAIEKQYEVLKEDYTCYVFDRKKVLKEDSSIFDLAKDLKACLSDLGVNKAYLYGVSQGGMIALAYALLYPDCVEKLFLVSTSGKVSETSKKVWETLRKHIYQNDIYNFNMDFYKYVYSERFFEENKKALERIANRGNKEELNRFLIFIKQMDDFDVLDRLKEITCPTYVVGGMDDKVFSYEEFKALSSGLNCELFMFENEAHALYDEVSNFPEIVKKFFDKK